MYKQNCRPQTLNKGLRAYFKIIRDNGIVNLNATLGKGK